MAVSIGSQQWYKDSTEQDPDGFVAWMMAALQKGGRLIENPTGTGQSQYANYSEIYADLQAFHPDIAARLPTPDMVAKDPVNYAGIQGQVFNNDEVGAAKPVPAPAPSGPPATPPDPAAADAQKSRMQVFNTLSTTLDSLGMGELFKMGTGGAPGGWLWDQITSGTVNDSASLNAALEATPVWGRLYGGVINGQRAAAKANPTQVHIMTPAEIAQYRQTGNQLARQYNLPTDFYDDPHDWDNLMIGQVDPTELQRRIVQSWNDVANSDPTVAAAFDAYHGITSASQMAAFFLDPSHSQDNVEQAAREAVIGGAGTRYGFGLQRPLAERIARNGVTQTQAEQQFASLQTAAGFFRPNVGETGDLTDEAIANQFGVSQTPFTDVGDLQRRHDERLATTAGVSGGPAESRAGIGGVGAAV